MTHSEQINEIAGALAKAQGAMKNARKDSANPFFKSKYADLAAVCEACREQLAANGIAVVQTPSATDDGRVVVTTMLVHASGQWFADSLAVKPKDDGAQAMGSVITYLRRYSLAAFAGVAPEDDDGNAAVGNGVTATAAPKPVMPGGFNDWLADLEAVADEGTPSLEAAWKKSKADYRAYLTLFDNAKWEGLKAKAAKSKTVAA
jgi:hypothetical protein